MRNDFLHHAAELIESEIAVALGRRTDTQQSHVGIPHGFFGGSCGCKQPARYALPDNFIEPRLEKRGLADTDFFYFVAVFVDPGDVVADAGKARRGHTSHVSEPEDSDMVLLF
jgi:hypothetical protein